MFLRRPEVASVVVESLRRGLAMGLYELSPYVVMVECT
jgi:hypothetical protein